MVVVAFNGFCSSSSISFNSNTCFLTAHGSGSPLPNKM